MRDLVLVRQIALSDLPRIQRQNASDQSYHKPWVHAPMVSDAIKAYAERLSHTTTIGFLAEHVDDGSLVGVVNLNNIVRGGFQCAALGYYGYSEHAGSGLFTAAMSKVIDEAFGSLGLHRLEANIQPGNERSLSLVQKLGFRNEGFSPRFLNIGGEWRDHQRWALLSDEWN